MNITDVSRLQALTREAEQKTTEILRVVTEVWTIQDERGRSAHHCSFVGLEGDTVICSGDEYWAYGGHENHTFSFPIHWLTFELEHIRKIEANKKAEEDAKDKRAAENLRKSREEKERAELKRLQEKYADAPTLTELMR